MCNSLVLCYEKKNVIKGSFLRCSAKSDTLFFSSLLFHILKVDLSQHECLPVAEEVIDCNLDTENQCTESEKTVATTTNERVSEALRNKKAAIMKNIGPPKKQSKIYSNFQESVSQLRNIVDSTVGKEDEYDRFALYIAALLRKLPERSFMLQDQIQSLITKEVLKNMTFSNASTEGTSRASYYSYRGSLPSTPSPQATFQPIATFFSQEDSMSTPSPQQNTCQVSSSQTPVQQAAIQSQMIIQKATYEIQETSPGYFEQHANVSDQQQVIPQEQANDDDVLQRAIQSIFPTQ